MGQIRDFSFPSSSGQNDIHCRSWTPDGKIRGVVQIVHGVAEHIGRYDAFARFLNEHGFAAAGDDHLGHGLSIRDDAEKGWFAEKDGWNKLVRDEKTLRDRLREAYPGVPLILLGHSMGSFIARTYTGIYPNDFDAFILSGTGQPPAIVSRVGHALAAREIQRHGSKYRSPMLQNIAFGSYLKRIEDPIGPNDWMCRDEAVIRAYDADPLCGFVGSAGLMYDMTTGLNTIGGMRHMAKMNRAMPVLFISGEEDPVGGYGKQVRTVAERFRAAGMQDVSVKLYPGARHEVLNELNKEEVWNDVLAWLESKI